MAAAQAAPAQKPAEAPNPDLNGLSSQLGSLVMTERSGVIELRLGESRWRIERASLPIHAMDCESSSDRKMCKDAKEDPCVKCIQYSVLVAWDESRHRVFLGVATGTSKNKPWVLVGYDMKTGRVKRFTNAWGGLGNGVVSPSGRYLAYSLYGVCGACCSVGNVEVADVLGLRTAKVPLPHDPSDRSTIMKIRWTSPSDLQIDTELQKESDCRAGVAGSIRAKTNRITTSDLQFR